jgi:hypothetical protein
LKRQGESARKANPKLPVGLITTKPANISIRDSRGAQFMQEHFVRDGVKSILNIKLESISWSLTADSGSHEVKKRYQISNCRF